MKTKKQPLLMLIGSMLIWGTIGLFRRHLLISSASLSMLRGLIGGSLLLLLLVLKQKNGLGAHSFTAIIKDKKKLLLLFLSGVFLGLNWILLFESYNHTSIAVSTLCYYMQPTIVILLSPVFFKEKITPLKLCCVVISVIGISLISGISDVSGVGAVDLKGILYGLGAALLYALVVITNKLNPVEDAYVKTIIQLFSAALVLLPYILVSEGFAFAALLDGSSMLILLAICAIHTAAAYAMYFGSINRLPSQSIAIMSYIDPVFAIFLSTIILSEPVTMPTVIGGLLLLGSCVVLELKS